VSELAAPFDVSLPAIMKHLGVLSDAAPWSRAARPAALFACRLEAEPSATRSSGSTVTKSSGSERLSNLAAFWSEEESCPPKPRPNRAFTLKRSAQRRPAGESLRMAWTDPEKVKGWMGPGEIKALSAESDLRVGRLATTG